MRDVISIKLIDYIADNMDVPELVSSISEISVVACNVVRISNFVGIAEYSEDRISVSLPDGTVDICGDGLCINVITDKYLQISGKIANIGFVGDD